MSASGHRGAAYEGLRDKYAEMLRMRRDALAGDDTHDPKQDMRALAKRHPGALREIDELPLEEIEARVGTLEEVVAGRAEPPEWAVYFLEYHGWMRAVLRVKRLCLDCEGLDAAVERARSGYDPEPDEPSRELLCQPEIVAVIVRPRGGRLNPWIFERIALAHGVHPDHVRDTLFPPRHSC